MLKKSILAYSNISINRTLGTFLTNIGDTPELVSTITTVCTPNFIMIPSETFLTYQTPVVIFNLYKFNYGSKNLGYLQTYCSYLNGLGITTFYNEINAEFDDVLVAARNDTSYNFGLLKLRGGKANQFVAQITTHTVLPIETSTSKVDLLTL